VHNARIFFALVSALFFAPACSASEVEPCLARAARAYNVPVSILDAIRQEEGLDKARNPEFAHREHAPINLSYIALSEAEIGAAIRLSKSKTDHCENYRAASWHLARALRDENGDIWKAVRTFYAGRHPSGLAARMADEYVDRIRKYKSD
jgi:soluble lytic murein transglycosylase-like protein